MPLPAYGFDPTEAAVPWQQLTSAGFSVAFATPGAVIPAADSIMLTGKGLGLWSSLLKADRRGVAAYSQMTDSAEFRHPLAWSDLKDVSHRSLLLPGGHHAGVREYLESPEIQAITRTGFARQIPVAAICHGVLIVARTRAEGTDRSLLKGYQTTALLRSQELLAWNMTRLWMNSYYRTYPGTTVEDEVRAALADPSDFHAGGIPLWRDTADQLSRGFVVRDRHYLSARWPGDAHALAAALIALLRTYRLSQ